LTLLPLAIILLTPPLQTYTVEQAVQTALSKGPRALAAESAASAARAAAEREKPSLKVDLSALLQGTAQGPNVNLPAAGSSGTAAVLPTPFGKFELNLDMVLYRPGRSQAQDRYTAMLLLSSLERTISRRQTTLEVRRACVDLWSAEAAAVIAADALRLAQSQTKLIQDLLDEGTASERDLLAAKADEAEAQQNTVRAESGRLLAAANLARLMGDASPEKLRVALPLSPPQIPTAPETEQALRSRPEISAAELGIRIARAGARLAAMQTQPVLSARATAAQQTPTAFVSQNYYAATLQITWGILDSGRARLDAREAEAKAQELTHRLEEARLGIRMEVAKAYREMVDAHARMLSAHSQISLAEKALEISRERYKERAATQVEVSAAMLAVVRAKTNRAQAEFDLHRAAYEYRHAVGGV
jgi:outer membrane protein TolC